jgi:hypothetical protein
LSFLGAAFLMALPLIAVPVAIHLYRGRQRDVIPWGAMQFLATAATKGRSVERLEEWLLMLLRLAAIAALVFALARPMVRSSWLGHGADGELILVLDNSLSTSREANGEAVIDRIKARANDVIDAASSNESVQIVLAAGAEWATAEGVLADGDGKRQLRQIVEELAPTQGKAVLLECVRAAVNLQAPEGLSGRRIVVISDDQASSWQAAVDGPWRQLAAARDAADYPINIEAINAGPASPTLDNLAVAKLDAAHKLVQAGDDLIVSAEIVNTGSTSSGPAQLEWLIEDKVVQTTPLESTARGGSITAAGRLPMKLTGTFLVSCRIARGDQIELDQSNSLVVEVAEHTPVLLVQSANASGQKLLTSDLLQAALGYADGKPEAWHSVYQPEVIEPAALATRPLDNVSAVLIDNLAELDAVALERLNEFVRAGGGLWVGLGDRVDRDQFNRDWYADGSGLSPVELAVVDAIDPEDQVAGTIHPPSRDHPATVQLANTTQLDIDQARVTQRWTFAARPESAAISPVLESGDGRPLVAEHFVGQGRVLIQAMPLGLEWTNLPLMKAYVVMIHDGLDYITAPTSARFNLTPGAPIVAIATSAVEATLLTPRGREIALRAATNAATPSYRYAQTRLPGVYRLRLKATDGSIRDVPFQVERDPAESNLQALSDERRAFLSSLEIRFDGVEAPAASSTAPPPPRREPVWGALLIALIAFLIAEMLLASWLGRQRHGFPLNAA